MKLNLSNVEQSYTQTATLNANFDAIEAAIENTLSRDGTTPNEMLANIDMNDNDLLNANTVDTKNLVLNGVSVSTADLVASANLLTFNVKDYGAKGDGINDDTLAIVATQEAAASAGGGTVYFPSGEYKVTSPITMKPQITYRGPSKGGLLDYYANKAKIFSTNSDIFRNSADMTTEVCFRDLVIESKTGGGHIFDWSLVGIVAKTEVDGCALLQRNAGKCVLYGAGASTYIGSLWMHDFEFAYAPANTVPAIWIAAITVNSVVIDKFWSTCTAQNSTGKTAIHVESTNPGGAAFNITVRDGVFEYPASGSVKLLSVSHAIIDNCTTYDLSIPTGYHQFVIDRGATGPSSTQITIKNCRSTVGNATWADLYVNMNEPGQGAFLIDGCTFSFSSGGTLTAPYTQIANSTLGTVTNWAYTEYNAGPLEQISFKNTDATAAKVDLWNGYPGNGNGYFNISVDNTIRGRISKAGFLFWGQNALTGAGAYISPTGTITAGQHIYPGTPAGAQQLATGFLAGTGAPSAGNNGDFYFRADGTTLETSIYQKRGGTWGPLGTSVVASPINVSLSSLRNSDGSSLTGTGSGSNFGSVVSFGTNFYLKGANASSSTVTSNGWFEIQLPNAYVAGTNITVTVNAEHDGGGTQGATRTLTMSAYRMGNDGLTGANIIATSAATFSASATDYTFTITGTTLSPNERISLFMSTALQESGGGALSSRVNSVRLTF